MKSKAIPLLIAVPETAVFVEQKSLKTLSNKRLSVYKVNEMGYNKYVNNKQIGGSKNGNETS